MSTFRHKNRLGKIIRSGRSLSGQALIESAAALTIFSLVFVMVTALAVNTYFYMTYMSKLEIVAAQAAKVFEGNKYFLGMQRKDFDTAAASDHALTAAKGMARAIGLPEPSSVTFEDCDSGASEFMVCEIKVPLKLPFAVTGFPALLTLTAKGVSAASSDSTNPPAVFAIQAPSSETGSMVGAMLPAYGTFAMAKGADGSYGSPSQWPGQPNSFPGAIKTPYYYTGISINPGSGAPSLGGSASLGSGELVSGYMDTTPYHL